MCSYIPAISGRRAYIRQKITRVGIRAYTRARIRVRENVRRFWPSEKWQNAYTRAYTRMRVYARRAYTRAPFFCQFLAIFVLFFGFLPESNPDLKEDLSKLRLSNNNSTRIIILNFLARNVEKLGMTFCRLLPNKSRKRPRKSPGRTGAAAIFGRERGGATGKTPRHPRRKEWDATLKGSQPALRCCHLHVKAREVPPKVSRPALCGGHPNFTTTIQTVPWPSSCAAAVQSLPRTSDLHRGQQQPCARHPHPELGRRPSLYL